MTSLRIQAVFALFLLMPAFAGGALAASPSDADVKWISWEDMVPDMESITPWFLKSNKQPEEEKKPAAEKPQEKEIIAKTTEQPKQQETYRVYPSPKMMAEEEAPQMPVYKSGNNYNAQPMYGAGDQDYMKYYDLPSPQRQEKTSRFPPVSAIGNQFFPVLASASSPVQLLPVASNRSLVEDQSYIERAIIVIHDITRNSGEGVATLATLSGDDNASNLILAPQFPLEVDVARFAAHLPQSGLDVVRWQLKSGNVGWQSGEDSTSSGRQQGISSFATMDLLLMYLSDRTAFPSLKSVVIAGHGVGADFVLRYAAAGKATELLEVQRINVRFLVANASSYIYMTSMRPSFSGGRQFGLGDKAICPDTNKYPYGLEQPVPYVRGLGANALKEKFPEKNITYLLAGGIVSDTFLDSSCAAMAQGKTRFERGKNFERHVFMSYGELAEARQRFVRVPNAGYDPVAMYGSYCGLSVLFGNGECEAPATGH